MHSTGVAGYASESSAFTNSFVQNHHLLKTSLYCTRTLFPINIPGGKEDDERKENDPAISGRLGISRPGYNGTGQMTFYLDLVDICTN